jgi:large subunit ribosomal protein L25
MAALNFELEAQQRDDLGKGASRRLRRANRILGVVYGGDEAATSITLDQHKVFKALENEAFYSKLLSLKVNGKTQQVILRDLQRHPYKPIIMHMDFLRVKATDKIHMTIPIHFLGHDECPGVLAGGVLNHLINELDVRCLAGNIPEFIAVDVSKLELDGSIHLSELAVPEGVELSLLAHDHNPVVASVHMPRQSAAEVEEEAAAAAADAEAGAEATTGTAEAGKEKAEKAPE